jgi:hypothetical protein
VNLYHTPLKPKPGARARRADGRPAFAARSERQLQPVTNREWLEQRRKAREADIFEKLFGKLLGRGRANG